MVIGDLMAVIDSTGVDLVIVTDFMIVNDLITDTDLMVIDSEKKNFEAERWVTEGYEEGGVGVKEVSQRRGLSLKGEWVIVTGLTIVNELLIVIDLMTFFYWIIVT